MGELIPSIVAHALLGVALALLVLAVGAGWLRLFPRLETPYAYVVGLLVVVAAAWLVLVSGWLAPLALLLLAPAALGLRLPLASFVRAVPFALGLGVALGALLHGPTADEDSHAYTDMLFYAAKLVSAHESVLPFRDLLVAGESSTYAEAGSSFVGGALYAVPGVDAILLQAATIPAFLVAALALGFAVAGVRAAPWQTAALGALAAAVVAYPTWLTESPPVALALPLAFALEALVRRPAGLSRLMGVVVLLGIAFALTKGFGVVPLTVVAGYALLRDHRRELDARRVLVYGGPVLVAALVVLVFIVASSGWLVTILHARFLPADAVEGVVDQFDHRDTQAIAPTLLLAGELLLGAALARARAWPELAVLGAAVAGNWFVGGHGFDVTVAIAVVLALLFFLRSVDSLRAERALVVSAGVALALSVVCRDILGVRIGFVLTLILGCGVLAALASGRAYALVAAVAAVGVAAVAPGISQGAPTLEREDYLVWKEVHDRVSSNGLVFTSETGPEVTVRQGWNYYPGLAARQVYLAGWSASPLFVDDAERERRLALNEAVLAGEVPAASVTGSRRYGRFYAVVRRRQPVTTALRVVYQNDAFTLYEIP